MADLHVVSALRDKRGELAGLIDGLQDQLRQAMIDLDHVDCTLRLFDPEIALDEIKAKPVPPRHPAFKGQVTRAILAMLRKDGPLDARAITVRLMTERELNTADKSLADAMHKRVGAALRNARDRGLTVSREPAKGGLLLWRLQEQQHAASDD